MTPEHVADLLHYLTTAYPSAPALEADTPAVWLMHLHEIPADTARDAAHRWVAREKWMPSIAELIAECRIVEREAYLGPQQVHRALPAPASPPAEVRAILEETRRRLSVDSAFEHQHKDGPESCPVCGPILAGGAA